ncbi:MAG: hypothetical protein AAF533_28110 [Acidobacteriota bacterium]
MTSPDSVTLVRATQADALLLENLLSLYLHDLSAIYPMEPNPDGRFVYDRLPLYWTEPDRRRAYLIESEDRVAGFALTSRGSPATDDPEDLDTSEFFILRADRRSGIGKQAAHRLWDEQPGRWVVRVPEVNRAGSPFWRETVSGYTGGDFSVGEWSGRPERWAVYTFASRSS